MRVQYFATLLEHRGDGRAGAFVVNRQRIKQLARFSPAIVLDRQLAADLERVQQLGYQRTMMSIDGDSDGCRVSLS